MRDSKRVDGEGKRGKRNWESRARENSNQDMRKESIINKRKKIVKYVNLC